VFYYWFSLLHRKLTRSIKPDIPVIAIGNFAMGGTGKTPLAIFVARNLQELEPVILSRGYGRKDKKVQLVRKRDMDYRLVGDEPLLIHWKTGMPVFVHKDRLLTYRIGKHLFEPRVFIMDDALQYWRIDAHVKIALLRKEELSGWRVFPFGLYREPIKEIERVDMVVVKGEYDGDEFMGKPAFSMQYKPAGIFDAHGNRQKVPREVVAFSGIAHNQDFFRMLESMGVRIVRKFSFPDHYHYKPQDIDKIMGMGIPAITTLKDFVRLYSSGLKLNRIYYLDIDAEINRKEEFLSTIRRLINAEQGEMGK